MPDTESFDVVIVGSGFGGAVTACRLGQVKRLDPRLRILLLERGRRYAEGQDFPRPQIPELLTENEDLKSSKRLPDVSRFFWRNDRGMFDVRDLRDLRVVQAAGLGGGSLIYAGVHLRPPAEIFEKDWPNGYDLQGLARYYELVEAMLDVSPVPKNDPRFSWTKAESMEAVADTLGRSGAFVRPPIAVSFEKGENRFGVERHACTGCGDCMVGCGDKAKNTLDRNYLASAEADGVEIKTLAEVVRLAQPARDGAFEVVYRDHTLGGREMNIRAKYLFMCAGAVNSTELLARNEGTLNPGGATTGLRHLGSRFFANGDAPGVIFDTKTPWKPTQGPTITTTIAHKEEGGWFLLQDGGVPKTLERCLGFLQSPLWFGRNGFGGDRPFSFESGVDIKALAAFLRGLPSLAMLHTRSQKDPAAESDAKTIGFMSVLPQNFRELLDKFKDPSDWLKKKVGTLDDGSIDGLSDRWAKGSIKFRLLRLFLGLAKGEALVSATTDAIVELFPWVKVLHGSPNLVVMALDALLAILLGPKTDEKIGVLLAMGPDTAWRLECKEHQPTRAVPRDDSRGNVLLFGMQERLMRDVATALKGRLRTNPGWTLGRRPMSVHAQGGCSMGPPEHGVTNECGQVHGLPNLYVFDGSVLPKSVGVNPSNTIAAVAERNVEAFIKARLGHGDFTAQKAEEVRDAVAVRKGQKRSSFAATMAAKGRTAADVHARLFWHPQAQKTATAKPPNLRWHEIMEGFVDVCAPPGPDITNVATIDKHLFERLERNGQRKLQRLRAELDCNVENLDDALLNFYMKVKVTGTITTWRPTENRHVVRPEPHTGLSGWLLIDMTKPLLGSMRYELKDDPANPTLVFKGVKQLRDDPGMDAWRDLTTLHSVLTLDGQTYAGVIRVPLMDFVQTQLPSMKVEGGDISTARKAWLTAKFVHQFQKGLSKIYPLQGV